MMLSASAAALTVMLFTAPVYAAEAVKKEIVPAPAAPAAGEVKKEETTPAERKGKKASKVKNVKSQPAGKKGVPQSVPTEKK
jgi:hypothetical protein